MIEARQRSTTALTSEPYPRPADRAEERVMIAKAFLKREPLVLTHPWTGDVVWVESEPADWRDFLEQFDAEAAAKRARSLH